VETRKHLRLIFKKTCFLAGFFVPYLVWSNDISPPQVVFGLLLLSTAVVLIFDIIYNPFGNHEDDLSLGINSNIDIFEFI
tara:strand:+ start:214 stop:453 length:240 start_codon:yes stop_codon:yes gene_type:complete